MDDATDVASPSDIRENARGIMQMCAFKAWRERVDGQIDGRKAEALNPMKSQEESFERNYRNGEAAGMMAAVRMWDLLIAEMETEINRIIEERGDHVAED